MLKNFNREKLINAIVFFAENTLNARKTKMLKLLYFLDFSHYRETGRSVTGLTYFAWDRGPVPKTLFEEMEAPLPDFNKAIKLQSEKFNGKGAIKLIPVAKFKPELFTRRELRLMENLAKVYFRKKARDMVEATHLENQPWHHIYETLERKYDEIPYELALRNEDKEELNSLISEREEFLKAYS
jgi:uncharacterized phage-associated protein